jgi:hypothetical protein
MKHEIIGKPGRTWKDVRSLPRYDPEMSVERFEGINLCQVPHQKSNRLKRQGQSRIGCNPEMDIHLRKARFVKKLLHDKGIESPRSRMMPFGHFSIFRTKPGLVQISHPVVKMVKAPKVIVRIMVGIKSSARFQNSAGRTKNALMIDEVMQNPIHREHVEVVLKKRQMIGFPRNEAKVLFPSGKFSEKVPTQINTPALLEVLPGQTKNIPGSTPNIKNTISIGYGIMKNSFDFILPARLENTRILFIFVEIFGIENATISIADLPN